MSLADLAQNLILFLAVIPHEIVHRSITGWAGTVFGNITFHSSEDRTNRFVIVLLIVRDKIFPFPFLMIRNDMRKLINLEFLVLRRMRIIKSPLLKRNVSTDKVN